MTAAGPDLESFTEIKRWKNKFGEYTGEVELQFTTSARCQHDGQLYRVKVDSDELTESDARRMVTRCGHGSGICVSPSDRASLLRLGCRMYAAQGKFGYTGVVLSLKRRADYIKLEPPCWQSCGSMLLTETT